MNLFHLDSSIRAEGSVSRELSSIFRERWQAAHPEDTLTYRDLATEPPPHLTVSQYQAAFVPEDARTKEQRDALLYSQRLSSELRAADVLLISSPLYNWSVPSTLKAWVDHVNLDRGLAGEDPALAGRPALLVMAKGGAYGPGTPREGWDYGEPWLRRILSEVWRLDLEVIVAELTLAGVNPALSHLQDVADASLARARESAAAHALQLASRLTGSPA